MTQRIDYSKLSPQLYGTFFTLEKQLADAPIDKTIKELIKIRVSQMNGCLFCLDMHWKEAKRDGESDTRLVHLPVFRESPLFSAKEKAALEWAELLTRIPPHGVEDEAFAAVSAAFTESEISALTFAIISINAWNRLGVSAQSVPGSLDKMLGLDGALDKAA